MSKMSELSSGGLVLETDSLLALRAGGNILVNVAALATQDSSTVAFTGGTINGTVIGGSTPAAGSFTTGAFSGTVTADNITASSVGGTVRVRDTSITDTTQDTLVMYAPALNTFALGVSSLTGFKRGITLTGGNDVSFYNTAGTGQSLFWDASAESLGIGTSSPTSPLHIRSATDVNVRFDDSGSSSYTWYMNDAQNIYIPNVQLASTHTFYANGQRKVDIDASGNVGIGTSSPSAKLELNVPSGDGLLINSADIGTIKMTLANGSQKNWGFATTNLAAGDFGLYQSNSNGGDPITAGTAKLYINSSGNLGLGTSSPNAKLTSATASGTTAISIIDTNYTTTGSETNFLSFFGTSNGGTVFATPLAEIGGVSQNGSLAQGSLVFKTTPFSGVSTTRMTLDASGNLLVGTTTIHGLSGAGAGTFVTGLSDGQLFLRHSGTTAGYGWYLGADASSVMQVYNQSGVGVTMANGATAWSATSDERLKDIIEPITDGLAKVRRLRSVVGKYKSDDVGVRRAFLIAQDVLAEQPEAVDQTNPDALALRSTEVIPLLVSALHDASDMIEALTARIEALEGV